MFRYTHKSICQLLAVMMIGFGATVAAQADQIVFQTNFQPPTALGTYASGSEIGSPGSLQVLASPVSVVADPCVAAGGTGQCLLLSMSGNSTALKAATAFGPGSYRVDLSLAGGDTTADIAVALQSASGQTAPSLFIVAAHSPFTDYQFTTGNIGTPGELVNLYVTDTFNPALLNSLTVTQLGVGESPVPEPSSWALLLTAGLGFLGVAARRRSKARPLPACLLLIPVRENCKEKSNVH